MEDEKLPITDSNAPSARSATALRELESRARAALAAHRQKMLRLESEITSQLDSVEEILAAQRSADVAYSALSEATNNDIEQLRKEAEQAQLTWQSERSDLQNTLSELRAQLSAEQSKHAEQTADLELLKQRLAEKEETIAEQASVLEKLNTARGNHEQALETIRLERETEKNSQSNLEAVWEAERAAWTAERTAWDAEKSAWDAECKSLEEARSAADSELAKRNVEKTAWEKECTEWNDRLTALTAEQQSWAEERTTLTTERSQIVSERNELQQKFDLALKDVQRFRSRAAELEQELASRPAADQSDSAELVALRAERDALADRIEELERAPKKDINADLEQQMADCQRRFELAVEDVRELKTKNAKLESQLAECKPKSAGATDSGGMDWESQKRRLLASLADEGSEDSEDDAARQKDRVTVANTIEITDAVVAEKDREIKILREQLADGITNAKESQARGDSAEIDLVDADEVVQGHRRRLAELEKQMEETLRTAELELSVERARMARQRMELEELRDELAQRESQVGPASSIVVPKKRWLSKLGLSGDD